MEAEQGIDLITDEQARAMVMATLAYADPNPVDEEDFSALTAWAEQVIIDHILLKGIFEGQYLWEWNGKEPVFKLSKRGTDTASKLINA